MKKNKNITINFIDNTIATISIHRDPINALSIGFLDLLKEYLILSGSKIYGRKFLGLLKLLNSNYSIV